MQNIGIDITLPMDHNSKYTYIHLIINNTYVCVMYAPPKAIIINGIFIIFVKQSIINSLVASYRMAINLFLHYYQFIFAWQVRWCVPKDDLNVRMTAAVFLSLIIWLLQCIQFYVFTYK